jgi:hypothetical protein
VLRTTIRTRAIAVLSVAGLAVVAVACGDDDDNASNVTSGGTEAAATTEGGSSAATTSPSGEGTTGGSANGSGAPANPNERAPKDPANPVQGPRLRARGRYGEPVGALQLFVRDERSRRAEDGQ